MTDTVAPPPIEVPVAPPRRFRWREALANPCEGCEAPCCRYLPLGTIGSATLIELDFARHLLDFDRIELGIGADGTWSAYYVAPCRHLVGNRCSLHGTPDKPHICVQYDAHRCWYRSALSGPGHPDHLRIDRRRMERLLEGVELDEDRKVVSTSSWEELQAAFADLPIDAVASATSPGLAPDPSFTEWQDAALGRKLIPVRAFTPAHPVRIREDPCSSCAAHCCTSLMFPLSPPVTASTLDHLRFALGFEGTEAVITDEGWHLAVRTTCRHLEGTRCGVYGQPERPLACDQLDAWACSYRAIFEPVRPEHAVRVRLEELPSLVATFSYDANGVAETLPTVEQIRGSIERAWAAEDSPRG